MGGMSIFAILGLFGPTLGGWWILWALPRGLLRLFSHSTTLTPCHHFWQARSEHLVEIWNSSTTQLHHSLGPFTLSFDSEADGKSLEGRSNYEQHAHQLLEFLHFDLEKKSQLHFWVTSLTSFHQRAQWLQLPKIITLTFVPLFIVLNYCIGPMAYL